MILRSEKRCTCNICGVKIAPGDKAKHFRKFHPEYAFHVVNGRYYCDICGKSVSDYKNLVESHTHDCQGNKPNIMDKLKDPNRQHSSWLFENYNNIATFYIDCLNKAKTKTEFKISDYALNEALYLADLNEVIKPAYFNSFLGNKPLNAIKNKIKKNEEPQQMENNVNKESQGISRDQIIGAIEDIIIENRQLKTKIKEGGSLHSERIAELNSEIERYKKIKEEDNGVISELNRQLELSRIGKERAELALRQKIAEGQKAMIVKISNQEEKQSIEERPY